MKNIEEFAAVVRLPDGEPVSVFLSVVNRQINIRTSEESERFQYLRSIDSVMQQVQQILAEHVGHSGGNTVIAPMGASSVPVMPVQPSISVLPDNGRGYSVFPLEKGRLYAHLIWQAGMKRGIEITAASEEDNLQSFQAFYAQKGIQITDVVFIEGNGQIILIPQESVSL